jgi:sulfonate transport system ATP-binding protein
MNNNAKGYKIEIKDLSKSFGSLSVLEHINVTINEGDFVAIVGESGCGKSTLLRMISGLDRQTSGSLAVEGKEISGVDSNVRFVFQEARLLPWKTALDNVRHGAPDNGKEAALKALDAVGLGDRAQCWPMILSGGQTQRVALARAIAGTPKVLLLDEPMGALDALTRIEMQNLVEKLWLEQGFTAVLVTHDVSEAVRLADRVLVFDDHRVVLDQKIDLKRPREKDAQFADYEQLLLNTVLRRHVSGEAPRGARPADEV